MKEKLDQIEEKVAKLNDWRESIGVS